MTQQQITRENIDELLDHGKIEIAMRSGKWWSIRRNGATKKWKRDANRICIPIKFGMRGYDQITEYDFDRETGILNSNSYRIAP